MKITIPLRHTAVAASSEKEIKARIKVLQKDLALAEKIETQSHVVKIARQAVTAAMKEKHGAMFIASLKKKRDAHVQKLRDMKAKLSNPRHANLDHLNHLIKTAIASLSPKAPAGRPKPAVPESDALKTRRKIAKPAHENWDGWDDEEPEDPKPHRKIANPKTPVTRKAPRVSVTNSPFPRMITPGEFGNKPTALRNVPSPVKRRKH